MKARSPLTPREKEILSWMMTGLRIKEIARHLDISALTVRKHRSNTLRKLRLANAAQLLQHARSLGLKPPSRAPRIFLSTESLSPRQRSVLQYVSNGHTSKQIARVLGISERTVRKHRENILRTLGLHCTSQLISFYVTDGLITHVRR